MAASQKKGNYNAAEDLIRNSPAYGTDKVVYYCGETTVTYRQLEQNVNRFANALRSLCFSPQERVLIVLPDLPEFVYAFLGSIKYGATPIAISTMLEEDDYRYMLNDSEASLLVTNRDSKAAQIDTERLRRRLFLDEFEALLASESTEAEPYLTTPDATAFWLYSSGSTGRPKGTLHKQMDMAFVADAWPKKVSKLRESDVLFSVSKIFFAYGLSNSIPITLRIGTSTVLLPDRPSPDKVIETIQKYRPTILLGVPTMYNSVLKIMKNQGLQFPSLRYCVTGGEPLPPEIYRQWKAETGMELHDSVGSTEALHIYITNCPEDPSEVKEASLGTVVPGFEAKIVDDEGNELDRGDTGLLHIRGGSLASSYWNRPEENQAKFLADGWFNTGDMYSRQNGYFSYEGRGDDMLKVGGIWVSPMEVENALLTHDAVYESAVVGQEVQGLVKPFGYVVLKEHMDAGGQEKMASELLQHLGGILPKFKIPWAIYFLDELPKTGTGKIQRFKLRRKAS